MKRIRGGDFIWVIFKRIAEEPFIALVDEKFQRGARIVNFFNFEKVAIVWSGTKTFLVEKIDGYGGSVLVDIDIIPASSEEADSFTKQRRELLEELIYADPSEQNIKALERYHQDLEIFFEVRT